MREQQVVHGTRGLSRVPDARRMDAVGVPEQGGAPRLVEGGPARDAVMEGREDDGGVLGEALGRVTCRPAAGVLERLRQVPVIEGHGGLDARGEQLIDEAVIEVEPGAVRRPGCRSGWMRGQATLKR